MTLRTRFALLTGSVVLLVVVAVGTGAYMVATRQLRNEVDKTLNARVQLIAEGLTRPNQQMPGQRRNRPLSDSLLQAEFDTVTQIIDANGDILASAGPIELLLTPTDIALSQKRDGFHRSTVTADDRTYRVLSVPLNNGALIKVGKDIQDIQDARAGMRLWFALITLIGFVSATLLGWLFARRTSKPLEQLAQAAESIAATQNLDHEVIVSGDTEVRQLATSFNTMLTALRSSLNRQSQLVQDASHELRTPLTSLRANTELLERSSLSDSDRAAILADMRAEVDELADLSTELSALTTDHRQSEDLEAVNLGDLTTDIVTRARRRTTGNIAILVNDPAVIHIRPQQVERAISNLIDNAIKFSLIGADIEVIVTGARVQVRDHGPGIADEDKPRIFDRFYRATATRSMPGSGLGLAIVQQCADDHGAKTFALDAPTHGAIVGIDFIQQ